MMEKSEMARWPYLLTDEGEIDNFLLTPLGKLAGDVWIAAVEGGYGGRADPAECVLYVRRGLTADFITIIPIKNVSHLDLGEVAGGAVSNFVARHQRALLHHWCGVTDSMELLEELQEDVSDQQ